MKTRASRSILILLILTSLAVAQAPVPPGPKSDLITGVRFDKRRFHKGDGDMWPITWARDGQLYGAAGDNMGSPMNFWRIEGNPIQSDVWPEVDLNLIDNLPVDPKVYCQRPHVDHKWGVKPASLLSMDGVLYFAVELMNYGEDKSFNRQRNVSAWIMTSADNGKTWRHEATPQDFFTGRLASPHFLQFGRDYEGARDGFVYAYFPAADDGNSYWENGDSLLLGRVPKDKILARAAWQFYAGAGPKWSNDEREARAVFRYPRMTGEDHVSYNAGLKRYILGNYGFIDPEGKPRPYHQKWPDSVWRSQLTLYEAPEPWGPWSLFHRDDNWGMYGGYQPGFPTKWMSPDGRTMWMVSAGTWDDYNFTFQKVTVELKKSK